MESETTIYVVWAGGVEVSNLLYSRDKAIAIARDFADDGYDDVVIEKFRDIDSYNDSYNDNNVCAEVVPF